MEAGDTVQPLWPIVIYAGACVALAASMLLASYVLGERHRQHATGEPYESGIVSTGSARLRFPVKYYLVAVDFVIFDLEAVSLPRWHVQVGWTIYHGHLYRRAAGRAGVPDTWRYADWATRGGRGYA